MRNVNFSSKICVLYKKNCTFALGIKKCRFMKGILYYLKFVLANVIGILFFSVSSCGYITNDIGDFEQNKADSIIAHNNLTIIYLWAEWCYASRSHFTNDVAPYLLQKSDTIGFVSIFYGSKKELKKILTETECDYPTFRMRSISGFDKIRMYKLLNSFLKDYKIMNYVPVAVICDKQGNILNYKEDEKGYSHIIECIHHVKGEAFRIISK